ncbi:MAG TPA: AMP-binding protein, partial [Acidimicrobiia bacterium]|nr:AMP-binding protein [Acidimicrobiia bacterium]
MPTQETNFALADGARRLSDREVDDLVGRAVTALDRLGLPDGGGRLAVMGENHVDTVIAHLAALAAGVSSVPVARYLGPDEIAYILRDSGAAALLSGEETAVVAGKAAADAGVAALRFDSWLAPTPTAVPRDRPARTLLVYTSGTTGRPKGTDMRWLRSLPSTVGEHLDAVAASSPFPPGPHLVVGPLHHTGPLSALRHALAGRPVVILGRFDPEAVLSAIEEHGVASTVMVPTHFVRLLALPASVRNGYDVTSLRRVIHTGAACPVEVKRAMIDWWGPVLSEAYGGSESGTVCAIEAEDWLTHPGSVGRPVAGFEALVLDRDGRPLPPGVEGPLWFRDLSGRGVRYHGVPADGPEPGLFTLGEIGRIDADGFVYITDRESDMVVSGGVNLYPAEAEAVLARHPAVADVAVIGVPHADLGEALHALVVPAPDRPRPEPGDLDAFCRSSLAAPKCPRSYEFVATVGRNAMGKLDKRALRRPYWPTDRTI